MHDVGEIQPTQPMTTKPKITKYNEYKRKADAYDRLVSRLIEPGVIADTLPLLGTNMQVHFNKREGTLKIQRNPAN